MTLQTEMLTLMIAEWRAIAAEHFDDYTNKSQNVIDLQRFKRAERLYAKAQMVTAALMHYKIELER